MVKALHWVDGGAVAEAESNHRGDGGAMEKRTERGRRKSRGDDSPTVVPRLRLSALKLRGSTSPLEAFPVVPGGQFHSKLDLYDRESDALCNTNKRKTKKIGESGLRSRYLPQLSFLQGYC